MAKTSGMGMGLAVAGYNVANDIASLAIRGGPTALDMTGIDKSAFERIGGLLDGGIDLTGFLNDATDQLHPVVSGLVTTDRQAVLFLASTIGADAACLVGKQLDYTGTRGADGSLQFTMPHPANGFSLEWCDLLTAGYRTDTSGTNGTALDGAAASSTGWAAYLQVLALTGTNVVVTLEDSADNVSFATFTGSAFTSVTAARTVQRLQGGATATVRRYVRAVTSGTFTSAQFIVAFTRAPTAA